MAEGVGFLSKSSIKSLLPPAGGRFRGGTKDAEIILFKVLFRRQDMWLKQLKLVLQIVR
jgi:hypothetical protein